MGLLLGYGASESNARRWDEAKTVSANLSWDVGKCCRYHHVDETDIS